MADKSIYNSPIWDDIRTLQGSDFVGVCDIIYGGFPCQDISIAGLGKGLEGKRSGLFFEIMRLAEEIQPKFIFLENVPAITCRGGISISRKITEMGYDCRWCVISASSVGALHKRERFFLLAHSNSQSGWKANKRTISNQKEQEAWVRSGGSYWRSGQKSYWKENKHPLLGMDNGLPYELDRAKALGNAVVLQQAQEAFEILMGLNKSEICQKTLEEMK
jgi:DNA (cytosine-5)-methyltransferase 1